jgi:hypothetical protein
MLLYNSSTNTAPISWYCGPASSNGEAEHHNHIIPSHIMFGHMALGDNPAIVQHLIFMYSKMVQS